MSGVRWHGIAVVAADAIRIALDHLSPGEQVALIHGGGLELFDDLDDLAHAVVAERVGVPPLPQHVREALRQVAAEDRRSGRIGTVRRRAA